MAKSFRVKLVKGLRGTNKKQREAVRCLGLNRINSESILQDNPANRGQISAVHHLLEVVVVK
jgi:large subunit ribosomal protein L30